MIFFLDPPGDFAAAPFQPGILGFTSPALGRGEMRLTILSLQTGARELTDVTADETVSALKTKLYESNLIDVQPTGQRLIFSGRTLGDGEKLATDAGIADGDVVVLVKRRGVNKDTWDERDANKPAPDLTYINKIIAQAGSAPDAPSAEEDEDVEGSLQGLRIIDPSTGRMEAAVNGEGVSATPPPPEAQANGITLPEPDARALEQLLEMGFPEARARKALLLHRNHPGAAMEWLLEVGDSPEADAELTDDQIRHVMSTLGMRQPMLRRRREPPGEPDEAVVQRLIEMGFPREEVLAALAATHNDHDAACAWLLGDRGVGVPIGAQVPVGLMGGPAGARGNAESMHMLLGDILSHPTIQEGLQSERVLQAFQSMIEDPSSAHDYMNDPEVGPILLRVHSILARVADQQRSGADTAPGQ